MYPDRTIPDEYEKSMPEIFPESAPGNFTYIKECDKWVMTVFHNYQWDLNYTNPEVFVEMLDNIFFYANLGVDMLRIDAPAFIWKQIGTTCQNLPKAHTILN
jgi:amylosucrase